MAVDAAAVFANFSGAFPDVLGVNATGPSATDGTEFVAIMINNYLFGPQQALLDFASLTPDAVTEAAGASQTIEAIQKGFAVGVRKYVLWSGVDDPSVAGDRVILLSNQGVLRSTYTDLDNANYVGNPDNPTAPYFYHADDAAGTTRNTAGIYLILPPGKQLYEKQYLGDGTDFTITGFSSLTYATAIPYQTDDGVWRLRFNIAGLVTLISRTTAAFTISGVTWSTNFVTQAISGNTSATNIGHREYVNGTNSIVSDHATSSTNAYSFSGDVELDSEPTWTDGFNYKLGIAY